MFSVPAVPVTCSQKTRADDFALNLLPKTIERLYAIIDIPFLTITPKMQYYVYNFYAFSPEMQRKWFYNSVLNIPRLYLPCALKTVSRAEAGSSHTITKENVKSLRTDHRFY